MASFNAIPLSYPPPLKDFIHWDPTALEPKAKSKAKAKEKPKTTECNLNEDGPYGYEGDWAGIDDFLTNMSGPNRGLLATAGAAPPPGLRHLDGKGDFNTVLPPQIPQSQQAVGVEDIRLVGDRDFDGISPEFPILLDDDAVLESDSIADTQSTDRVRDDLNADLDAACMSSFSAENVGGVYNNDAPEQDELYVDVGMGTQPLATRKRTYASSAEVLDSEDSRSAKRRSSRPQSDIIAPSPMCTPTTPPPPPPQTCGSHLSPLGVRNDPNAGNVDGGGKDNSVETSDLPQSSRVDSPNGGDGQEPEAVIDAKSLHSPIQSSSPAGQRGGDQGFSPDSGTSENESDNSDSEPEESNKDNRWRGPPRTGPRPQGRRMPTATSRQLRLAPPRYPSSRKAGITTRSGSPRRSSPVKTVYGSSIDFDFEPSHNTADQLPDITYCHVPRGSLIVTSGSTGKSGDAYSNDPTNEQGAVSIPTSEEDIRDKASRQQAPSGGSSQGKRPYPVVIVAHACIF
ncbi:hypothetical protein CC78DRAFT_162207 [Lojkania enalia]|uniref:Uncharacterized protein n=1 Tax=Lojkania enalia TaxID=147567 RepID=A0A9P4JVX1_9PLEO|nr:hypothetical protein CC78DRAFT_162207 [Didymosphaeria enalia]